MTSSVIYYSTHTRKNVIYLLNRLHLDISIAHKNERCWIVSMVREYHGSRSSLNGSRVSKVFSVTKHGGFLPVIISITFARNPILNADAPAILAFPWFM